MAKKLIFRGALVHNRYCDVFQDGKKYTYKTNKEMTKFLKSLNKRKKEKISSIYK